MQELTAWDEVEEAEIRTSHRILLRLARTKFGEPDAAAESELRSIQSLD